MTTTQKNNNAAPQEEPIRLLLIDDEADHWAGMFDQGLYPYGFRLAYETNPDRVASAIGRHRPHVILLDLHFPHDEQRADGHTTGGVLLGEIRRDFPGIPVVVFTSRFSDDEIPLEKFDSQPSGWFDKHQISEKQKAGEEWAPILAQTLNNAIEAEDEERRAPEADMGFVVGATAAMKQVTALVRNAAKHMLTVLIYGETGTGKLGVAEAIHRLSGRMGKFERLNCSGVHEDTLNVQLFGHAKGAYTGSVGEKPGLFELANGGSLFLDEIQDMPRALQNLLMTAVENGVIRRMGSDKDIKVDVRLIVATNQPLDELVADEILREDLAQRLRQFEIRIPPLRERMQDIPALWRQLIGKANEKLNKHVTDVLRPEVKEILDAHYWPGNIRELESVIMRAVAITRSNVLFPADIEISPLTTKKSDSASAGIASSQPTAPAPAATPVAGDMNAQAADIATKIDGLPVEQRYSFVMGNLGEDLRRRVLIEIITRLRNGQGRKVKHKDLAAYLDVIKDSEKDLDRIRRMVVDAGVQLTKLECNH